MKREYEGGKRTASGPRERGAAGQAGGLRDLERPLAGSQIDMAVPLVTLLPDVKFASCEADFILPRRLTPSQERSGEFSCEAAGIRKRFLNPAAGFFTFPVKCPKIAHIMENTERMIKIDE